MIFEKLDCRQQRLAAINLLKNYKNYKVVFEYLSASRDSYFQKVNENRSISDEEKINQITKYNPFAAYIDFLEASKTTIDDTLLLYSELLNYVDSEIERISKLPNQVERRIAILKDIYIYGMKKVDAKEKYGVSVVFIDRSIDKVLSDFVVPDKFISLCVEPVVLYQNRK